MTPEANPPLLNLVLLTGRVLRRTDLSLTYKGVPVITVVLENSETGDHDASEAHSSTGEISVEIWGELARRCDELLKPGEPVFIEAQVAGRQKQDRNTKLVQHWMVLKARRIELLTKPIEHGGM